MIPISGDVKNQKIKVVSYPSYTYNWENYGDRIRQYTDGIDAIKQAIYKILTTDRYKYEIYSWNYGIDLDSLMGKPKEYIHVELERRIIDALSVDDRIKEVYNFQYLKPEREEKTTVYVKFNVDTIYGELLINQKFILK